jgi:hypothetical protein
MSDNTIKLENGIEAKRGGRYTYKDSSGINQYLDIFYVDQDKAYRASDNKTVVLTPTASWTHELGDGPWQKFHKNGSERIVLSKDTWNEIRVAEEIEVFDYEQYAFVSNRTGEITKRLIKPVIKNEEKSLNNLSEKVVKNKMSTNSTLEMLKEAGIDAAKMVGANQANEIITAGIKKALQAMGLEHEFLESDAGHKLIKTLSPLVIHYAASTQAEFIDNFVGENASENIKEGCKFAVQASLNEIMGPLIEHLVPLLKDLATMGASSIATAAKSGFSNTKSDESEKIVDGVKELMENKKKAKAR